MAGSGPGMLEIKCPYNKAPWDVPQAYYMAQVLLAPCTWLVYHMVQDGA